MYKSSFLERRYGATRTAGWAVRAGAAALLLPAVALAASGPVPNTAKPRLATLVKRADLAMGAEVVRVTEYDNGRLAVVELKVNEVIKGRNPGPTVRVVEWRDQPVPPAFEQGRQMLVLLDPTARTSYLAAHIPPGPYYALIAQQPAYLSFSSAAELADGTRLVQRLLKANMQPAPAARVLTFDLLAADQPFLVEEGIARLGTISDLAATLSPSEQARLESVLDSETLPLRVRLALIRAIAAGKLTQLAPALRRQESPELVEASWKALAVLAAAPPREEIEKRLASDVPQMRSAALRELLRTDKADAIPRITQMALKDTDAQVRTVAIEALGETGTDAVPALEQIFNQSSWDSRRAVARALHDMGGRTPAEAYTRLAFSAPPEAQRYAVVLLLASGVTREDPLVQQVIKTHPNEEIRQLAEHGIDTDHH